MESYDHMVEMLRRYEADVVINYAFDCPHVAIPQDLWLKIMDVIEDLTAGYHPSCKAVYSLEELHKHWMGGNAND